MSSHRAEETLLTDSAVIDSTGEPVLPRFMFMVALCVPVMATAQDRSPIVVPDEDSELDPAPKAPIVPGEVTEPTPQPDEVPDSPKPYRRIELPEAPEMAPEWLGDAVEERREEREEGQRLWPGNRRLRYGDREREFELSVDGFLRVQAGCIYPNSCASRWEVPR